MRKDLPRTVIPSHYDLEIDARPEAFRGTVVMHLRAENAVTDFKFNSQGLELSELEVNPSNGSVGATMREDEDFVSVSLDRPVEGSFTLSVKFAAAYSRSMEGFYRSEYNGDDLFSTHFEPSDARKAFPCFDQPDMKATFSISIRVPKGFIALSNERETERREEEGGTLFRFERTPVMSTYIVAYVVGKLGYIESRENNKLIRVYAHESEKEWGDFALKIAVRCLEFYERYFEFKYPLGKLDMVAIPSFAAGAMENWGLVTYRKTSLLFDPATTSTMAKKNIAVTVSHELAHMWFGNLVTMKWWDDLWLNEGFATWAATLALVHSCQDVLEWDVWTSFINDEIEHGMNMDCKHSTHSIGSEVNDPVEVNQKFDAISYSKGSSVIKMLENWLGAEVFRKGLVHYVKKFSYGNAVTDDLWQSLSTVANSEGTEKVDVAAVIGPWVSRPGFPYISVEEGPEEVKLTQRQFTVGYRAEEERPWPIPIRVLWLDGAVDGAVSLAGMNNRPYLMDKQALTIPKESPRFKLNDEVSAFYRTKYADGRPSQILEYHGLSTANRINIFSDAFALAKALYTPLQDTIALVDYLDTESNYEVLSLVIGGLSYFRSVFYDNPKQLAFFDSKLLSLIRPRFMPLRMEKEGAAQDINTVCLNSLVVGRAVALKVPEALEQLQSIDRARLNPEYLRPYLVARVDQDFPGTFKLYRTSSRPGEKQGALIACGASEVEKNVDFLFENIEQVAPQDSISLFMALSTNLKFRNKAAMRFIEDFKRIRSHIGNAGLVRYSLEYLLSHVYEGEFKKRVLGFLETLKDDREMKSAVDKCRDALQIGDQLRAKYSAVVFE